MEVLKCMKVIVPEQEKKRIVAHVSRKKIAGASAFGGLAPIELSWS